MKVVALGELLIDYTFSGKSEFGMDLFEQNAGGAPANVLASLAKFDIQTAFIGKVGNDMQGLFLKKTLDDAKIDTSNLIVDDKYFTTLAFVSLAETGERSFAFARKPGADTMLEANEVDCELIKSANIFHMGSLSLTHKSAHEATFEAIKCAKENGVVVSYDPNYRAPLWDSKEEAVKNMRKPLEFVDVIKISDEECELMTGDSDPKNAAKILNESGIPLVAVTLGGDGCIVCANGEVTHVKGFKPERVADTTGAGDSFWGGFLYALGKKHPKNVTLKEAEEFGRFANSVASLCVENFGAIKAMPTLDEVEKRLAL